MKKRALVTAAGVLLLIAGLIMLSLYSGESTGAMGLPLGYVLGLAATVFGGLLTLIGGLRIALSR